MAFDNESIKHGSVSSAPIQGKAAESPRGGKAMSISGMQGERKLSMPGGVKSKMEKSFNANFSNVSMYESPSVSKHGFDAMAQGNRIGFAPGKFNPSTTKGQGLLGHELSHVVSHAKGQTPNNGGRVMRSSAHESRADAHGAAAAMGRSVAGSSRVSVPSGTGGGSAAIQGGTEKVFKDHFRRGPNQKSKQKFVDSVPYLRKAVQRRGMHNIFNVSENMINKAEDGVHKTQGVATPVVRGGGGSGRSEKANEVSSGAQKATSHVTNALDTSSKIAKSVEKSREAAAAAKGLKFSGTDAGSAMTGISKGGSVITSVAGVAQVGMDVYNMFVDPSFENGVALIKDIASTSASILNTVDTYTSFLTNAAPAALPAVGIVIAGADIIEKGIALAKSAGAQRGASKIMSELQGGGATKGYDLTKPEDSSKALLDSQKRAKAHLDTATAEAAEIKTLRDEITNGVSFNALFDNCIKLKKQKQQKLASLQKSDEDVTKSQEDVNKSKFAKANQTQFAADQTKAAGFRKLNTKEGTQSADKIDKKWEDKEKRHARGMGALRRNQEAISNKAKSREEFDSASSDLSSSLYNKFVVLFLKLGITDIDTISEGTAEEKYNTLIKAKVDKAKEAYDDTVKAYFEFGNAMRKSSGANIARLKAQVDTTSASMAIVSDIINIAAGACEISGVAAPVGAALAGLSMAVQFASMIATISMKSHMKKKSVSDALHEKAMHQSRVMEANGIDPGIAAPTYKGRYAKQSDKLDKIDEVIQDIIDEVYQGLEPSHPELHATRDASNTAGSKKKHGGETTKYYKRMALFEMGVPRGFRADIHNNLMVNHAVNIIINATSKHPSPDWDKNASMNELTMLNLVDKGSKLHSVNEIFTTFGNQEPNYRKLIKRSESNPMIQSFGGAAETSDEVSAKYKDISDQLYSGASEEDQVRMNARDFGRLMTRGRFTGTGRENKSLEEQGKFRRTT